MTNKLLDEHEYLTLILINRMKTALQLSNQYVKEEQNIIEFQLYYEFHVSMLVAEVL